jgi:phosphoglycerate dehydrogenase-like enzyme
MVKIAVLDDWQGIARKVADWSPLTSRAEVAFYEEPLGARAAEVLADYDIVLTMRERLPVPASLVERLPKLRMLGMTGNRAPVIDIAALTAKGVVVSRTGGERSAAATAEMALALTLAAVRRVPQGDASIRVGRFQEGVEPGFVLDGRTLGIVGLGRIGSRMAAYGRALGMQVLAWSQNLTDEKARAQGARLVSKRALFAEADVVSVHLVLSDRTRGLIGSADIARMKPGAVLVNTSRGPIVEQKALVAALQEGRIRAGLDVFDEEPLSPDHPLRTAPNTALSPHLGYCVREIYEQFYRESIENVLAFLEGKPIRQVEPTGA